MMPSNFRKKIAQRNKFAQIQTQIFVYILALIVIALVLLYGYTSIKGFITRSEQVNLVQFRTDLSNAIEMQSTEYGSVIMKKAILPKGFNKLIIIDLNKVTNTSGSFETDYPYVHDSWTGNVSKNVFLIGKNKFDSFYSGKIYFDASDHILIDAPDRVVKLKLSGMGSSTKIEKWQ